MGFYAVRANCEQIGADKDRIVNKVTQKTYCLCYILAILHASGAD
jgi:hypothetical protein